MSPDLIGEREKKLKLILPQSINNDNNNTTVKIVIQTLLSFYPFFLVLDSLFLFSSGSQVSGSVWCWVGCYGELSRALTGRKMMPVPMTLCFSHSTIHFSRFCISMLTRFYTFSHLALLCGSTLHLDLQYGEFCVCC